MTATAPRVVTLGRHRLPVVPPRLSDARLQTAAVIISIHVIGVAALGFRVSIPQILTAIVTSALIDLIVTLRRTGVLAWPASGMLTGSGVALILRVTGMPRDDLWSWRGWHWFALVSAVSIGTKYVIRREGGHVFNPSNLGLVAAFLVLGREVIEPLDFWWAPLDVWMGTAYVILLAGGFVITRRLRLLGLAVGFWAALVAGMAVLATSGHCISAPWSPTPVCDGRFWWTITSSPEVLVFAFFMITDPRTVPMLPRARVVFGVTVGALASLLIAPQTIEFGAKVALLAGLVLLSPARDLFDRLVQRPATSRRAVIGTAVIGSAVVASWLVATVAAGAPARTPTEFGQTEPVPGTVVDEPAIVEVDIDPATLPPVTVDPEVATLNSDAIEMADELALQLAEDLAIERLAILSGDLELLRVATSGQRFLDTEDRIEESGATVTVSEYEFDSLRLRVVAAREGQSVSLGFDATGTETLVTFDADGTETGRESMPFARTFLIRSLDGENWRIVQSMDEGE